MAFFDFAEMPRVWHSCCWRLHAEDLGDGIASRLGLAIAGALSNHCRAADRRLPNPRSIVAAISPDIFKLHASGDEGV